MIVRPARSADHEAIARILVDAFGGPAEARLVELLRGSDAYVADLELVAQEDGEVVGHILLSKVRVGDEAALALAPMAVAPSHQRKGVGTALARAGLELVAGRSEAAVIVLGHPGYYPRFGFVPARRFGIEPPWPGIPDEAFLVLPLPGYTDACRGVVAYPPAFDAV